jgi:hypothetical protein
MRIQTGLPTRQNRRSTPLPEFLLVRIQRFLHSQLSVNSHFQRLHQPSHVRDPVVRRLPAVYYPVSLSALFPNR